MWETFALLQFFDQPLFILKRELKWIPLFGWYLIKSDMIGIDRAAGGRSLLQMARRAGEAVRRGRQLIIFPEGTRTAVDCAAAIQDRRRPDLCRLRRDLSAGGAQFGPVLAAPNLHALPGNAGGRISRSAAARVCRGDEFIARVSTVIEEASSRLVEAARREQAKLFGRVPNSASAKA